MSLTTPAKVEKLQKALHAKAKEAAGYRFYQLYDKVYRTDVLMYAYQFQLLPAGTTFAGWDSHPLRDGAFARRTEKSGLNHFVGAMGGSGPSMSLPSVSRQLLRATHNVDLRVVEGRSRVELFFKWIKRQLQIEAPYWTWEDVAKSQICIAVSVYVLVAVVEKRLSLDASICTRLPIFAVTLLEKMPLNAALSTPANIRRTRCSVTS